MRRISRYCQRHPPAGPQLAHFPIDSIGPERYEKVGIPTGIVSTCRAHYSIIDTYVCVRRPLGDMNLEPSKTKLSLKTDKFRRYS